jgi:hypothetical protein
VTALELGAGASPPYAIANSRNRRRWMSTRPGILFQLRLGAKPVEKFGTDEIAACLDYRTA